MLEDPDRSGTLAHDGRHVLHGEAPQHPKEDDVGLVRREGADPGQGRFGREVLHRLDLDVAVPTAIRQALWSPRFSRTSFPGSPEVEQPAPGDRKRPAAEVLLAPAESPQ